MFYLFLLLMGLFLSYDLVRNGKGLFNPVLLYVVFFLVPLAINQLKLSELQSGNWTSTTNLLIFFSFISFCIFPYLVLKFKYFSAAYVPLSIELNYLWIYVLFVSSIILNILVNNILSGSFVPFLNIGTLAGRYHTTETVGFLATMAIVITFAAVILSFIGWKISGSYGYLIISIISMALPLTRLARFDVVSMVFAVIVLNFYMFRSNRLPHFNFRVILLILIGFVGAVVFGAFLVKYRWSGGNVDLVSFADFIGYDGLLGWFEVFPFLYSYYALSFENIDRIVISLYSDEPVTYGLLSLSPISIGFLKLNYFFDFLDVSYRFDQLRDPLHNLATVPTFLPAFILDFGSIYSFIPMLFFSILGLIIYFNISKSIYWLCVYSIYSVCYLHSSFLNYFVNPTLGSIILFVLFFLFLSCKDRVKYDCN